MSKKRSREEEERIRIMMLNNQMLIDRRRSIRTAVDGGPTSSVIPVPPIVTVNATVLSNWANANRYETALSVGPQANTTGFTAYAVFIGNNTAVSEMIIGKSNSVTSTQGWTLGSVAGAFGLYVNNIVSPRIGIDISEVGKVVIMHGVVRSGQIYFYKNGVPLPGSTSIGAYTSTTFRLALGSYSGGPPLLSGLISAGVCELTGLDDSQVEAHYQSLKSDVNASAPGATHKWRSGDAGATWVDSISGLSTTRNGTVNTETGTYEVVGRYDYRATVSDTVPISTVLPNVAGGLKTLPMMDSRTAGVGGSNTNAWRQGLYDLIIGSGDFSNIDFVGPNSSTATDPQHNGNLGWTSGDHIVGKEGKPNISTVLSTYNPNIVIMYGGTNSANSDALMAQERLDYMTLLRIIYNFNNNMRIVVFEETESSSPVDNARLWAHNYWFLNTAWPTLKAEGLKLVFAKMYGTLSHAAGDFADSVHQNDQGYGKMPANIYPVFRLATGRL